MTRLFSRKAHDEEGSRGPLGDSHSSKGGGLSRIVRLLSHSGSRLTSKASLSSKGSARDAMGAGLGLQPAGSSAGAVGPATLASTIHTADAGGVTGVAGAHPGSTGSRAAVSSGPARNGHPRGSSGGSSGAAAGRPGAEGQGPDGARATGGSSSRLRKGCFAPPRTKEDVPLAILDTGSSAAASAAGGPAAAAAASGNGASSHLHTHQELDQLLLSSQGLAAHHRSPLEAIRTAVGAGTSSATGGASSLPLGAGAGPNGGSGTAGGAPGDLAHALGLSVIGTGMTSPLAAANEEAAMPHLRIKRTGSGRQQAQRRSLERNLQHHNVQQQQAKASGAHGNSGASGARGTPLGIGNAAPAAPAMLCSNDSRPRTSFDSDWDVMGAEADGFGLSAAGLAYMSSVATSGEHGPTSTNTNALGSGAGAGHGGNPGAHGGLGLRGGHGGGGLGDTGSSLAAGGAGGPGGTGESGSGVNTSGRQRRSGRHSSSTGEQASAVQHARAAIRTGGAAMASDQSSIVVSGAAALTTPGGTVLTSIHRTPGSRQHPEHDSTRTTLSVFLAAGLAAEGTGTASWPHMGMGGMDSSDQASPMAQAQGPAGQGVIGGSGAGRGGRGSSDRVDLSFNPNSQLKREATSKSGIARWLDGADVYANLPDDDTDETPAAALTHRRQLAPAPLLAGEQQQQHDQGQGQQHMSLLGAEGSEKSEKDKDKEDRDRKKRQKGGKHAHRKRSSTMEGAGEPGGGGIGGEGGEAEDGEASGPAPEDSLAAHMMALQNRINALTDEDLLNPSAKLHFVSAATMRSQPSQLPELVPLPHQQQQLIPGLAPTASMAAPLLGSMVHGPALLSATSAMPAQPQHPGLVGTHGYQLPLQQGGGAGMAGWHATLPAAMGSDVVMGSLDAASLAGLHAHHQQQQQLLLQQQQLQQQQLRQQQLAQLQHLQNTQHLQQQELLNSGGQQAAAPLPIQPSTHGGGVRALDALNSFLGSSPSHGMGTMPYDTAAATASTTSLALDGPGSAAGAATGAGGLFGMLVGRSHGVASGTPLARGGTQSYLDSPGHLPSGAVAAATPGVPPNALRSMQSLNDDAFTRSSFAAHSSSAFALLGGGSPPGRMPSNQPLGSAAGVGGLPASSSMAQVPSNSSLHSGRPGGGGGSGPGEGMTLLTREDTGGLTVMMGPSSRAYGGLLRSSSNDGMATSGTVGAGALHDGSQRGPGPHQPGTGVHFGAQGPPGRLQAYAGGTLSPGMFSTHGSSLADGHAVGNLRQPPATARPARPRTHAFYAPPRPRTGPAATATGSAVNTVNRREDSIFSAAVAICRPESSVAASPREPVADGAVNDAPLAPITAKPAPPAAGLGAAGGGGRFTLAAALSRLQEELQQSRVTPGKAANSGTRHGGSGGEGGRGSTAGTVTESAAVAGLGPGGASNTSSVATARTAPAGPPGLAAAPLAHPTGRAGGPGSVGLPAGFAMAVDSSTAVRQGSSANAVIGTGTANLLMMTGSDRNSALTIQRELGSSNGVVAGFPIVTRRTSNATHQQQHFQQQYALLLLQQQQQQLAVQQQYLQRQQQPHHHQQPYQHEQASSDLMVMQQLLGSGLTQQGSQVHTSEGVAQHVAGLGAAVGGPTAAGPPGAPPLRSSNQLGNGPSRRRCSTDYLYDEFTSNASLPYGDQGYGLQPAAVGGLVGPGGGLGAGGQGMVPGPSPSLLRLAGMLSTDDRSIGTIAPGAAAALQASVAQLPPHLVAGLEPSMGVGGLGATAPGPAARPQAMAAAAATIAVPGSVAAPAQTTTALGPVPHSRSVRRNVSVESLRIQAVTAAQRSVEGRNAAGPAVAAAGQGAVAVRDDGARISTGRSLRELGSDAAAALAPPVGGPAAWSLEGDRAEAFRTSGKAGRGMPEPSLGDMGPRAAAAMVAGPGSSNGVLPTAGTAPSTPSLAAGGLAVAAGAGGLTGGPSGGGGAGLARGGPVGHPARDQSYSGSVAAGSSTGVLTEALPGVLALGTSPSGLSRLFTEGSSQAASPQPQQLPFGGSVFTPAPGLAVSATDLRPPSTANGPLPIHGSTAGSGTGVPAPPLVAAMGVSAGAMDVGYLGGSPTTTDIVVAELMESVLRSGAAAALLDGAGSGGGGVGVGSALAGLTPGRCSSAIGTGSEFDSSGGMLLTSGGVGGLAVLAASSGSRPMSTMSYGTMMAAGGRPPSSLTPVTPAGGLPGEVVGGRLPSSGMGFQQGTELYGVPVLSPVTPAAGVAAGGVDVFGGKAVPQQEQEQAGPDAGGPRQQQQGVAAQGGAHPVDDAAAMSGMGVHGLHPYSVGVNEQPGVGADPHVEGVGGLAALPRTYYGAGELLLLAAGGLVVLFNLVIIGYVLLAMQVLIDRSGAVRGEL